MKYLSFLLILLLSFSLTTVTAQSKQGTATKKKSSQPAKQTQKKGSTTGQKKGTTSQKGAKDGKENAGAEAKAGTIDPAKADTFRLQVTPLVKFFESSLNFLGDKRNDVSDMQTIISESYKKWCWNEEVQVEDDLDENRLVPLYKDMPAYLSDVDFFFKGAKFTYSIQDIALETGLEGASYFKVTANRNLRGLTINGDSVNSNKVRYIEINYDSVKQQLKIVSVYTTKLNEREELRNWWNALAPAWKSILSDGMKLEGTLPMARIESFNDSLAVVDGQKKAIMGSEFYRFLDQIIHTQKIDLSGKQGITDLAPLNRLSDLQELNIASTGVSDLMPLRNLNKLEVLDISNTKVATLEPLRYCILVSKLRMRNTAVSDLSVVASFTRLSLLDIGNTPVTSLEGLEELTLIRDLKVNHTAIKDLAPMSGMTSMEMLSFSNTGIPDLEVVKNMPGMKILVFDSTSVASLEPLDGLTELQRVYCNSTRIGRKEALGFLRKHPDVSLVYATRELTAWWKAMDGEWQAQFSSYMSLNTPPTPEQLHRLVLLDSINIAGRASMKSLVPLEKLILLRSLQCQSTGITSLDALKELSGLKSLNASNTAVTDLKPLSGTESLVELNLDNTQVADLSPLFGLKKITTVYADNTRVDDAMADRFFEKNPSCLLVYQTYENNDWWKALSPAWKEVMQQQVSLKGEPDRNSLQQIAGLQKVVITENFQVSDITPVVHLNRLKELQFSGTTVSSLDPVSRIPKLQVLRCSKNPITSLAPVALLRELKELDFSNTQVEDIDALQNMLQLEVLKFSGTQVKNLKYLQKLVNIKVIEFYNTRVTNVDVLDGMTKLESVKMFNTKVSAKKVEKLRAAKPKCEIVYY